MTEEFNTDEEILKDLYGNLGDLIDCCMTSKELIKDMDNWETVHELEFQLELTRELLSRYLKDIEIDVDWLFKWIGVSFKELKDILKYIDNKISECVENNMEILGDYSEHELTDIEDIAHVNYYCGYEKHWKTLKNFLMYQRMLNDCTGLD